MQAATIGVKSKINKPYYVKWELLPSDGRDGPIAEKMCLFSRVFHWRGRVCALRGRTAGATLAVRPQPAEGASHPGPAAEALPAPRRPSRGAARGAMTRAAPPRGVTCRAAPWGNMAASRERR